jgi:hypothetical protein
MKVEPIVYGDRTVYSVAAFNPGVAQWLQRLPALSDGLHGLVVQGESPAGRNHGQQSLFILADGRSSPVR